jgi:tetratricopeptide (TPR) repeat protein
MFCEKCGARIEERELYCPQCGVPVGDPSPGVLPAQMGKRQLPGWLWLLGVALLTTLLLLCILALGVAGVYQGLQERARLSREAAVIHHDRGQLYLKQGEYELAQAEFEEALRLAPDYGPVQESLREVQSITQTQPTPTSEAKSQASESFLQEARTLYAQEEWERAVEKLLLLRRLDPDFKQREVERLLFSAYYNQGLQQVEAGRLEEAIQRFDEALEVRPNDPSALRQKEMARLYLAGMEAWGADWAQAIESFEALYRLDENYMDVASRLYEAYRMYGDLYASEKAWCLAQTQYGRAAEVNPTEAIMARWRGAYQRCAEAVATERTAPPSD